MLKPHFAHAYGWKIHDKKFSHLLVPRLASPRSTSA